MLKGLFRRKTALPPARIPPGLRVYAVGDVHGRADLLASLLDRIAADAGSYAGSKQLVFLGDYVDRGVESRQVIDLLTGGLPAGFEAVFLKGNHEAALLDFLADPGIGPDWFAFGGGATLLSYGVSPDHVQRARFEMAREELLALLPDHHLAFLRSLRLSAQVGDYAFVHAGVRPGVPLERQSERDLLWIREEFLRDDSPHGVMIIHGHTVVSTPEIRQNRIGIDTGAYATGRLTALVLEGGDRRFLTT